MAKARSSLAALAARIDREALAETMLRVFRREIPGYGQARAQRGLFAALVGNEALDAGHHESAARLGFLLGTHYVAFAAALPGQNARVHARAAVGLRAVETLALTEGDRVVGL